MASDTISITLVGTCNYDFDTGTDALTIAPDAGESTGDAVTIGGCYSVDATAAVTSAGYRAVGGLGGLAYSVGCPYAYSNPDPASVVLNPGPGEQVILSLGPATVTPGNSPYSIHDCYSAPAQIGDVIQARGGVFGVVDGPVASAGTSVIMSYSVDIEVTAAAVPTVGRGGLLALALLLAAAGSISVRRRRQPS